eukprot:m.254122 g.254122  ORF g.254122 m.254122 type:complete len:267 (+) comp40379_c0_seq13:918-1718(+)
MLSQIVRLIEEAQISKAPIQRYADKIAGYFVPGIILISFIIFGIWAIIGKENQNIINQMVPNCTSELLQRDGSLQGDVPFIEIAFLVAISVLCMACPCALGLATPTAVMVGTGVGAQNGILIKGGESLETLHKVKAMVFDKTGTLTEGMPSVTHCRMFVEDPICSKSIAVVAAATAEQNSGHPLASAIVKYAKETLCVNSFGVAEDFNADIGLGVKCKVSRLEAVIGQSRCNPSSFTSGSLNPIEVTGIHVVMVGNQNDVKMGAWL